MDYVLGLAPTSTLRRHILGLEASNAARFAAGPAPAKVRRFKEFYAAGSWSRTAYFGPFRILGAARVYRAMRITI